MNFFDILHLKVLSIVIYLVVIAWQVPRSCLSILAQAGVSANFKSLETVDVCVHLVQITTPLLVNE